MNFTRLAQKNKKDVGYNMFSEILSKAQDLSSVDAFKSAPLYNIPTEEDIVTLNFHNRGDYWHHDILQKYGEIIPFIEINPFFALVDGRDVESDSLVGYRIIAVLDDLSESKHKDYKSAELRGYMVRNVFGSELSRGSNHGTLKIKEHPCITASLFFSDSEENRGSEKDSLQHMVRFVDRVEKYLDVATSHGFNRLEHQIRDGLWSLGKVLAVNEPNDVENILRYAGGPFYRLPYRFTKLTQKD